MTSVRLSQETEYYDAQYSIENDALGVSTGNIFTSSVGKMFPTGQIISSGKVVRSRHGAVSHIGIILAIISYIGKHLTEIDGFHVLSDRHPSSPVRNTHKEVLHVP